MTIGNVKITFSRTGIVVWEGLIMADRLSDCYPTLYHTSHSSYLQLIPEIVWILLSQQSTVGVGERLLALLHLTQLGEDSLQTGLEGVDLL